LPRPVSRSTGGRRSVEEEEDIMKSNRSASLALTLAVASVTSASDYRVERVASNLNQPNYLTQAPGDPTNVVYTIERVTPPAENNYQIHGFSKVNHMGRISRYDQTTRTSTVVLDLYDRKVFQDDGLQSVAFHPDFQTNGKMYVVSSTYTGTQAFGSNGSGTQPVALNRVEEYTVNVANPSVATTTLTRTVMSYTNNVGNNHTINWAGFDPTATGQERDYLYISTGDGAFGNAYNGGAVSGGRPSQNPASIRGKIHRVDVAGGDAYPGDNNKNFAIPASNPIPAYNALHPATPIAGPGEIFTTGMRNIYRAGFDRANGDLWMGDVGENAWEEINFLKKGANTGQTRGPVDFGWPQWEGMAESPISGAPHDQTNPFTGVTDTNPVRVYDHAFGSAVIGGYVYRGPIAELQGSYFYSDFLRGWVQKMEFARDTPEANYNGANGTVTDMTVLFNSLIFDATDNNYTLAGAGDAFGLDHIVSYGEDQSGNVYLVDFGGTAGDGGFSNTTGEYPGNGRGEIFRLVLNGDVNRSNTRTATDIDQTFASRTAPAASRLYDFNNNGTVALTPGATNSDIDYLIHELFDTEYGDANLDRSVDFDDLLALAQNYNLAGFPSWALGNFDGSGSIDFEDLLVLAQNYGFGTGGLMASDFAADWAIAQSLVPEPSGLLGLLLLVGGGRRCNQH
jgi:glucose/arabinose dehydrogenase